MQITLLSKYMSTQRIVRILMLSLKTVQMKINIIFRLESIQYQHQYSLCKWWCCYARAENLIWLWHGRVLELLWTHLSKLESLNQCAHCKWIDERKIGKVGKNQYTFYILIYHSVFWNVFSFRIRSKIHPYKHISIPHHPHITWINEFGTKEVCEKSDRKKFGRP